MPLLLDFQVSNGGSHVAFVHDWSHFEDVPGKPGWISQRSNVSTSHVEPGPTNFGGLRELGFTFVSGALGQLQIGYLKSHKTGMGIVNFTVRCDRPRGRSTTRLLAASHVYHRLRFDGSHNSPTSVPTYTTVTGLIPRAAFCCGLRNRVIALPGEFSEALPSPTVVRTTRPPVLGSA